MNFMAEKYRALRDKKAEIEARHKEELKPIREVMDQLEGLMQKQLNDAGSSSIKTDGGTVISSTRRSITIEDPDKFRSWCLANSMHQLLENRVSKEAVEEYVGKGNPLPPGLKVSSVSSIQVRKN